ncbi:hypothetical protein GCM10022419_072580 [Nonomuraea rosea]|uniref:DUF4232 domain-containing protein n=1 Tax=Nonomuraea rosea TaxID=638574 RepID=A0ABP6YD58_9ACTN
MLALSLGVAWLLLAPLSLWLLVKGSNRERAGALVTLALLECGTIAMDSTVRPAIPLQPVVAHALPADPLSCEAGLPIPQSATAGRELVLTWAAGPRECGTAEVVVRTRGRKLLVWLRESPGLDERKTPLTLRHKDVYALPVRVEDGVASLAVPLDGKPGYIPIDGRTGRRIPASVSR